MKLIILSIFVLHSINSLYAQRAEPDRIITSDGEVAIQPILHGTAVLTWKKITIYVDPYGGAKSFEGIQSPDLILITDIHGDHLNLETLQAINATQAEIIAPQAVVDKLSEDLKIKATLLGNGEKINFKNIDISAIPMYNLPEDAESRHTKGRGNGYVLSIGSKTFYFSGDTEDIPEMRNLKNIDIAFVCMNQPYTMEVEQAASAVLAFKPRIVYPYHYRGQGGLSDVEKFREIVNGTDKNIDVRLRNWYPEYSQE